MRKVLNSMLVSLCFIAGASFVFHSPVQLYDLVSGAKAADGFFISWPFIRVFTEPFYAFSFYALTLQRDFYRPVIISWTGWTVISVFIYCVIKKRTVGQTLCGIFYALMLLITLFLFAVLAPLPGPKLNKPDGYIAVDLHSHTVYSHDNLSKPRSNLRFHRLHGYDAFFVTEHNHTGGFERFPGEAKYKEVFPGVQMQTKDKVSVLLLSAKAFDGGQYKNLALKDIIRKAHADGMLVIMPHWWKWHRQSLEELVELGIDGFEIYNCGYRNLSKRDFQDIVKISKDNNLLMAGSTDWHGWGYMTDVWTVLKAAPGGNLKEVLDKKPETRVLVYRRQQSSSPLRFILEPFYAFYLYMKNADMIAVFSLMIWTLLMNVIFMGGALKIIKKYAPLAIMAVLALSAVFIFTVYIPARATNEIIPKTVLPVMIVCCALWFFVWRFNGKNIQ